MKENCAECRHHDVFWGDSGCNLLNNGERCKYESLGKPPITNADRIRAMSDEEMAEKIGLRPVCPVNGDCEKMSMDCIACWLDWLQQPAEEG